MENIPAIITAVATGIGGVFLGYIAQRRHANKEKASAEDTHLQTFYKSVNEMMNQQAERHSKEIISVRNEQADERKQWAEERKSLYDKLERQDEKIRLQDIVIHSKEIEVVELRGKVDVLTSQLDSYQTLHTTKTVTTVTPQVAV